MPTHVDEETESEMQVASTRKIEANRQNALKSTGPRIPRDRTYSRGNALTHGLTAERVMFGPDGAATNKNCTICGKSCAQSMAQRM